MATLSTSALPGECLLAIEAHGDVMEPHECSTCLEAPASRAIGVPLPGPYTSHPGLEE